MELLLPEPAKRQVDEVLDEWSRNRKTGKIWARDPSLWTATGEQDWLGWLDIVQAQRARIDELRRFAGEVRSSGARQILLLGMGGSSLCAEVLALTFGKQEGHPELLILDSTDPDQIRRVESRIDLAQTLFIVSSKSGGTLEPNIFKQYFFGRLRSAVGAKRAGERFVAITDPGSRLQAIARADGFGRVFSGVPSIGGRYSALSDFGMVPAAGMGLDVDKLLRRAGQMVRACVAEVPARENPGVQLGAALAVLAAGGRDKLTLVISPAIWDLGAWIEQLVAESTGKQGKAMIPVDGERPGAPESYGGDRVFVYLRLENGADAGQDAAIEALARAGQPVVRIPLGDAYDLGQEFFRWQFATAVAGSILGINPFDQPDVEASKAATRELTSRYEETGALPPESPIGEQDGIQIFADARYARVLAERSGGGAAPAALLGAHLSQIGGGDYFALLAYVEMCAAHRDSLQAIRHAVRDARRAATCLGFGPRFLHSTGQAYKGGPNTGVFLQLTCDSPQDLPVPGQKYTFGVVKAAQALGDFQVLAERTRRVLRVHLGSKVPEGLERLRQWVTQALV